MPFGFPTVLQSKSIALNIGETIVDAGIYIDTSALSDANDFQWYLTADGGTTWETATLNENHTFTTTGNDLRYQIIGNEGATITIRQSNGADYFLKVKYNE